MRTLRSAAAALAASGTDAGLASLAAALGFGAARALGESAAALGIGPDVRTAAVARGPGARRALLCTVDGAGSARAVAARLAARLAARSPALLWVLCVAEREPGGATVLAAWSPGRRGPRVAALVAERGRLVDSDAETVCALAAAADGDDQLTHARWLDVLGRESLTRRFYRSLERLVGDLAAGARGSGPAEARREVALLTVSRLLFLSFLEAKGWLDGDRAFLQRGYDRCVAGRGAYHARVLRPLFFGTLNTPARKRAAVARGFGRVPFLNGGLFARAPVERRWRTLELTDEGLGRVYAELLSRYRFTAREDAAAWSEAAVDPEMLGRAFESLMAVGERKSSGAFYTPQPLVERVTRAALVAALAGGGVREADVARVLDGGSPGEGAEELGRRAAELRVLDPACGSGAFLVHVMERLAALRIACGDGRPVDVVRREVLTRGVFGVDVNATAVWLCELRLWLSAVIDSEECDPSRVVPLPNLDRNVRVGDSLHGAAFGPGCGAGVAAGRRIAALRERYARAVGGRKRTLARCLEREERRSALDALSREVAGAVAERGERVLEARAVDLFGRRVGPSVAARAGLVEVRARVRRLRSARRALEVGGALPFSYGAHFADVAQAGGFGLVVGNPPWVRVHRVEPPERVRLREAFRVYREAAWAPGAAASGGGRGFGGQVDVAALFVERSLALTRPGGVTALLLPSKLWRSLAGGGVRRLLVERATLCGVEDYGDGPSGFDAAVYPSLVVARRGVAFSSPLGEGTASQVGVRVVVRRGTVEVAWESCAGSLGVDRSGGAPWLLVPPAVRAGFDAVRLAGGGAPVIRPWLGVKCGCNEAFVGRVVGRDAEWVEVVGAGGRRGWVEASCVRAVVRGEGVRRWRVRHDDDVIVWPVDVPGNALPRLPDGVRRWLAPYRARLERRSDGRRGPWWALFRLDGSIGEGARVVWSDIGRRPRAAVLAGGDPSVPLNSCYVLRCASDEEAWAWAALLNSPLAAAWLGVLAEPARGSYRRFLSWTVAMLPVPRRWGGWVGALADAGRAAAAGDEGPLHEAVLRAYGIDAERVEALLRWEHA